jgi:heterodisulfide reductase subunit D
MTSDPLDPTEFDPAWAAQVTPQWEKLLTCIQCGTCTSSCPSAFEMDYAPRQLWQMLKLGMEDQVLNSRTFWLCTMCKSCQVRCPRGISIGDTMIALREYAIDKGINVPKSIHALGETVNSTQNISGEDNALRLIWSENLQQAPLGVRPLRRVAEVVYFVGCVSSFYPRVYRIPQLLVQILEQAKVKFTTLGSEEWCCGYPLYAAGMGERLAELARHNVQMVRRTGARRVIFTCPSCYYTWTHLYPEVVDVTGIQLQHSAEFLACLLADGILELGPVEEVVTYHDPCDLGRKSGVYDAPREVLTRIPGLELREMDANRENALCCGGGGDVEMSNPTVSQGAAERRLSQVAATGARCVVSACQQCIRTLQGGVRRQKTAVRVLDLTELVWRSINAAQG